MKKTILIAIVVLVASAMLLAAAPGFEKLAKLTVWNRTGETIYILLTTPKDDGALHYYLTVKPGVQVFTVERKVYNVTYWSCGAKMSGIADVLTQLSLTFTDCAYLHRWTYTLADPTGVNGGHGDQELDASGRPLWSNGTTLFSQVGTDAAGNPVLVDAAGVAHVFDAATDKKKFVVFYTQPAPNVHNMGEPSIEKVHNTLYRWEWIAYSFKCLDNGGGAGYPVVDSAGNVYYANVWTLCSRVAYVDPVTGIAYKDGYWGTRSYRSPFWQGNYWDSYRFSYNVNSARSIHWQMRTSKMVSSYTH